MVFTTEHSKPLICDDISAHTLPVHKKKYPLITGFGFFDPASHLTNAATIPNLLVIENKVQKNTDTSNDALSYFIVMGLVIIAGAVLDPYFHVGLFVGVANWLISIPIANVLRSFLPINTDVNKDASHTFDYDPLYVSLIAPIWEELIFRGCIQSTLLLLIPLLIPSTATLFIAPGLSAAALMSVIITSVAFGLAHIGNNHSGSYVQGAVTTLSGLNLGLLTIYFGLPAAIASHIANNTLVFLISMMINTKIEPEMENSEEHSIGSPSMATL